MVYVNPRQLRTVSLQSHFVNQMEILDIALWFEKDPCYGQVRKLCAKFAQKQKLKSATGISMIRRLKQFVTVNVLDY